MARRARLCGLWFAAATRFFAQGPVLPTGHASWVVPLVLFRARAWAAERSAGIAVNDVPEAWCQRSRDCALCTYAVISHWQSRAGILLDLNAGCSFVRRAFGVGICCRPSFKGSDVAMWAPSEVAHAKPSDQVTRSIFGSWRVCKLVGISVGSFRWRVISKARVHEGPGRLNFELWLNAWVFLTFWFGNALRTIVACNSFLSDLGTLLRTHRFWEPTFGPSRLQTDWNNIMFRDFPRILRTCPFFLLVFYFLFLPSSLLLFSSFWLFLPLLFIFPNCWKFDF